VAALAMTTVTKLEKGAKKAGQASEKARPSKKARPRYPAPKRRVVHPGPPIANQADLSRAAEALRARDPELVDKLVGLGGPPPLRLREPGFAGLAAIIVAQQLSTASAGAILRRLEAAIAPLDAAGLTAASDEVLRACGLSVAKVRTLRAVSEAVAAGLDLEGLARLDAEEAHKALIAIKGIGPWTADIFLLFCLGHPDAFPAGDLALQEAAKLVLGLKKRPDSAKLETIAERWRPWRGIAARMLWAYYRAAKSRSGMVLAESSG
jgi:DNA-3-methyladenine glycosylase II